MNFLKRVLARGPLFVFIPESNQAIDVEPLFTLPETAPEINIVDEKYENDFFLSLPNTADFRDFHEKRRSSNATFFCKQSLYD